MKTKFIFIAAVFTFLLSCSREEVRSSNQQIKKKTDSTKTFNLTESQKKILAGAKKCLEAKFNYDMDMAYHVLKYKDGELVGSKVYPNGDLEPSLGVCTDVTVRALRWGAGLDLQEDIHNDISKNWNDYPMRRWNAKKPDTNIDHRRVPNQLVWLKKFWKEISAEDYQPGDVIIWDMNGDSWGDHIGIISDKFVDGVPNLIHNFPSPGYVAEEDVLNSWKIIGHFRVRD